MRLCTLWFFALVLNLEHTLLRCDGCLSLMDRYLWKHSPCTMVRFLEQHTTLSSCCKFTSCWSALVVLSLTSKPSCLKWTKYKYTLTEYLQCVVSLLQVLPTALPVAQGCIELTPPVHRLLLLKTQETSLTPHVEKHCPFNCERWYIDRYYHVYWWTVMNRFLVLWALTFSAIFGRGKARVQNKRGTNKKVHIRGWATTVLQTSRTGWVILVESKPSRDYKHISWKSILLAPLQKN